MNIRLLAVSISVAVMLHPVAAAAEQHIVLCVQSKNSPGCFSNTTARMEFDDFNKTFGSGPVEAQKTAMAHHFCTYIIEDKAVLAPYNVTMLSDMSGGEHGTTLWSITCLDPPSHR